MSEIYNLDKFVYYAIQENASDIHFQSGDEPQFRVDGDIRQINLPKVTEQQITDIKSIILDDRSIRYLDEHGAVDKGYEIKEGYKDTFCRLRVSFAKCYEGCKIVCRIIPNKIPTIDDFKMPEVFKRLSMEKQGMIIVAGVTGSGKSTTIASMIEEVNSKRPAHIVTLEDPIEFIHTPKQSIFTRREKNDHFELFSDGLRTALRQDPDVILVGEMRDAETIRSAMQAAETGHLVFATVHSSSSSDVPERIISTFPEEEQEQVRSQIADVGLAFIAQSLLKKKTGGRIAAYEILIINSAARNLIREKKSFQLESIMQTERRNGMITMTQSMSDLYNSDIISDKELLENCPDEDNAKRIIFQKTGGY